MKMLAFGLDLSGKPLFEPQDEEALAHEILQHIGAQAGALSRVGQAGVRGTDFRGEVKPEVIDHGDPRAVGWTFMLGADDPDRAQIIEILAPLAAARGMSNPEEPLLLPVLSDDQWMDWVMDNYLGLDLSGKKVPHYVLLVGGPERIPFHFQAFLGCFANVGRVAFDHLDQLRTYVAKILRLEQAPEPVVSREALLFATDGGMDDPTYYSRTYMVEPMATYIADELKVPVHKLLGYKATKAELVKELKERNPAIVFTASHGLGLTKAPIEEQMRLNGAICCKQTGGASLADSLFAEADVPTDGAPWLEGAIVFQFACFGYGTPAISDYAHWFKGAPTRYADRDFVAALPKALLAHPRGPICYIGHLDTAYLHGITDPHDPTPEDRWSSRVQPFVRALTSLLRVEPSGLSMEEMSTRYAATSAVLLRSYERMKIKGEQSVDKPVGARIVDMWIFRNDAQNYMIFGDPAVRLRLPD